MHKGLCFARKTEGLAGGGDGYRPKNHSLVLRSLLGCQLIREGTNWKGGAKETSFGGSGTTKQW